jgi:hypothetical protein
LIASDIVIYPDFKLRFKKYIETLQSEDHMRSGFGCFEFSLVVGSSGYSDTSVFIHFVHYSLRVITICVFPQEEPDDCQFGPNML